MDLARCINFCLKGTFNRLIEAHLNNFDKIYSIELKLILLSHAAERFILEPIVDVIYVDSRIEIKKVTKESKQPALLWLEDHYSTGLSYAN